MQINLSTLGEAAKMMQRLGELDKPEFLGAIGMLVENQTKTRIRDEKQAPDGTPWEPLSDAYAASKAERKGSVGILEFDGNLYRSIQYFVDGDSVEIGSNEAYAAIHNYGGVVKKPERSHTLYFRQDRDGTVGNQFVSKRKSNFAQDVSIGAHAFEMPARQYMGLSTQNEADINDLALQLLQQHVRQLQ